MPDSTASASQRLLDTASRLFYARGFANVGINEIIARAGVARMTLYHHFPSKDALVKAVLEQRRMERSAVLRRAEAASPEPGGQILAVFDLLASWVDAPDFRGCPLVSASFELGGQFNAALPYAREHLLEVRQFFRERLASEGADEAELAAAQLQLLLDGATVTALVQGNAKAALEARIGAEAVIARSARKPS